MTSSAKIVSGKDSEAHAWPWQVLIVRSDPSELDALNSEGLVCAGTLTSAKYIVTAAHCDIQFVPFKNFLCFALIT